jgi:hypothetical protein
MRGCPWPLDWQRHYRVLADLAADEADGTLPDIQPGVLFDSDDLGKWLQRMSRDWAQLSTEQQKRLTALGIKPAERAAPAPATKSAGGPDKASAAFQRGVAALAQYIAREGADTPVPCGHLEPIVVEGQEQPVQHRLGVWLEHQESQGQAHRAPASRPHRTRCGMGVSQIEGGGLPGALRGQ